MSENNDSVNEESMIKYLREKIIGHPAVFSRAGDLPIDENLPSIKRSNSQNSLNDVMSISTISNDTTTIDRPTSQVEKLIAASGGINLARRPILASSPIIIPKKPPRSNASSQSSSSYTSVVDQMSSLGESSVPSDDVSIPTLASACQILEHSAARDRISVKNKRRQPIKQKLSTLRETEDNELDLFSSKTAVISSTPEEEQSMIATTHVEPKIQKPLIDLSDLDTTRARLRMSARPRDRSADNILLATNTNITTTTTTTTSSHRPVLAATSNSPVQRSSSVKRPQEMNETKFMARPFLKPKKEDNNKNDLLISKPLENEDSTPIDVLLQNNNNNDNEQRTSPARSRSSSQEHIYDNLDVFKRPKPVHNLSSNEDEPSSSTSVTNVKTREHPAATPRLRPVTMHESVHNEQQITNEFENVFNQLKKRGSVRKVRPTERIVPEFIPVEEPPAPPPPFVQPENEPIVSSNKPVEATPVPQTPNRRKTVGGVCLPANNKVATNDNKPAPSWIDIAKQKQSKFQSVTNDKNHENECEQQLPPPPPSIESPITIRKPTPSVDIRSNRKSMYEQPTTQTNAHVMERDSIRALKAGNPNRINNLIQFFDK